MDSNNQKLRLTAEIIVEWHNEVVEWEKETKEAVENIEKRKQLATLENDFAD